MRNEEYLLFIVHSSLLIDKCSFFIPNCFRVILSEKQVSGAEEFYIFVTLMCRLCDNNHVLHVYYVIYGDKKECC
jgi:hypothetical protein